MKHILTSLFLLINTYGFTQQRAPEVPKVVTRNDERLKGTQWSLSFDEENGRLTFHKATGEPAAYRIDFIDKEKFRLTVQTKDCSFKAEGTYRLRFLDEGEGTTSSGNSLSFNRSKPLHACAENIKSKIARDYFAGHYGTSVFTLEEVMLIGLPAE